jgi:hypothetical protein
MAEKAGKLTSGNPGGRPEGMGNGGGWRGVEAGGRGVSMLVSGKSLEGAVVWVVLFSMESEVHGGGWFEWIFLLALSKSSFEIGRIPRN